MHANLAATRPDLSATTAQTTEQRVLSHLTQALRVMVEWRAPSISEGRRQSSVRFALRSFCRHLERLMNFEEQGGYLSGVAEENPCWDQRVRRLRDEHSDLRARIDRLAPQLDDPSAWKADRFEGVCLAIRDLLDEVEHHDDAEVALLQDAAMRDEGGEG